MDLYFRFRLIIESAVFIIGFPFVLYKLYKLYKDTKKWKGGRYE